MVNRREKSVTLGCLVAALVAFGAGCDHAPRGTGAQKTAFSERGVWYELLVAEPAASARDIVAEAELSRLSQGDVTAPIREDAPALVWTSTQSAARVFVKLLPEDLESELSSTPDGATTLRWQPLSSEQAAGIDEARTLTWTFFAELLAATPQSAPADYRGIARSLKDALPYAELCLSDNGPDACLLERTPVVDFAAALDALVQTYEGASAGGLPPGVALSRLFAAIDDFIARAGPVRADGKCVVETIGVSFELRRLLCDFLGEIHRETEASEHGYGSLAYLVRAMKRSDEKMFVWSRGKTRFNLHACEGFEQATAAYRLSDAELLSF